MDSDEQPDDELGSLRVQLAEWRRRAEMAEAVAAERLTRAEMAERALGSAEIALRAVERSANATPAPTATPAAAASTAAPATTPARPTVAPRGDLGTQGPAAEPAGDPEPEDTGPKSLRAWWRRYTDSLT